MIAFIEKRFLNQSNASFLDVSILLPSVLLFLKSKLISSDQVSVQVESDQFGLSSENAIIVSQEICTHLIGALKQPDCKQIPKDLKVQIRFEQTNETVSISISAAQDAAEVNPLAIINLN